MEIDVACNYIMVFSHFQSHYFQQMNVAIYNRVNHGIMTNLLAYVIKTSKVFSAVFTLISLPYMLLLFMCVCSSSC